MLGTRHAVSGVASSSHEQGHEASFDGVMSQGVAEVLVAGVGVSNGGNGECEKRDNSVHSDVLVNTGYVGVLKETRE